MNVHHEVYYKQLDDIVVPDLTDAIAIGRQRAEQEVKKEKAKKRLRYSLLVTSAACLFLFCIISIRVSPVFANALSQIPFMNHIVEYIAGNKGHQDIVDNQYYEEINETVSANGLSLTLNGVIADETGMVLFVSLASETGEYINHIQPSNISIKQNGKQLEGGMGYSFFSSENTTVIHNQIELNMHHNGIQYDQTDFILEVKLSDRESTVFSIPFELKNKIEPTKHIPINQAYNIEGQTIFVESLDISPLNLKVNLRLDEHNSMQILDVTKLLLIDENGEEWGTIKNGISASGSFRDEGEKKTYYMQSNYFREPKQLTLIIDDIEALPKGEDYIEVDFEKQKLLYKPNLVDTQFQISQNSIKYTTSSEVKNQSFFSGGVNALGDLIYARTFGSSSREEHEHEVIFNTEDVKNNPFRFEFNTYPHFLDGSIQLEVPISELNE